jgi:hypothetical protein
MDAVSYFSTTLATSRANGLFGIKSWMDEGSNINWSPLYGLNFALYNLLFLTHILPDYRRDSEAFKRDLTRCTTIIYHCSFGHPVKIRPHNPIVEAPKMVVMVTSLNPCNRIKGKEVIAA